MIICKNPGKSNKTIERYRTRGKAVEYLKAGQPEFGLLSTSLEWMDDVVNCSGVRSSAEALYDITQPGYLIIALGPIQDTSKYGTLE